MSGTKRKISEKNKKILAGGVKKKTNPADIKSE